jgi:hypothetical protein
LLPFTHSAVVHWSTALARATVAHRVLASPRSRAGASGHHGSASAGEAPGGSGAGSASSSVGSGSGSGSADDGTWEDMLRACGAVGRPGGHGGVVTGFSVSGGHMLVTDAAGWITGRNLETQTVLFDYPFSTGGPGFGGGGSTSGTTAGSISSSTGNPLSTSSSSSSASSSSSSASSSTTSGSSLASSSSSSSSSSASGSSFHHGDRGTGPLGSGASSAVDQGALFASARQAGPHVRGAVLSRSRARNLEAVLCCADGTVTVKDWGTLETTLSMRVCNVPGGACNWADTSHGPAGHLLAVASDGYSTAGVGGGGAAFNAALATPISAARRRAGFATRSLSFSSQASGSLLGGSTTAAAAPSSSDLSHALLIDTHNSVIVTALSTALAGQASWADGELDVYSSGIWADDASASAPYSIVGRLRGFFFFSFHFFFFFQIHNFFF